ncbi:MAG: hypothetical protein Q4E61_04505 [Alphaproteobacteria bacterium]|nr:hypothetical protein [Alphaproteobacteria bacterium]
MENHKENLEKDLLKQKKQKEEKAKRLLSMEVVIGVFAVIVFLASIVIALFSGVQDWLRLPIVITSFIFLSIVVLCLVRIEQKAGYYECRKCGHKYVPTYFSVFFAPHINRTRYMRCPKCDKKSWQKKVTCK